MALTKAPKKEVRLMSENFSHDVSEEVKAVTNHAVWVRGTIISSYAHIEFLLADLCLKAWKMPEYAHLAGAFPYKIDSRLKAVGKLFEAVGPLKSYRPGIEPALDELLKLEDLRQFVAHGLMIITPTPPPNGPTVEYRLYRVTKDGVEIAFHEASALELVDAAVKISDSLNQMLITFRRLYSDLGFELSEGL
jgi:hypothetical protein